MSVKSTDHKLCSRIINLKIWYAIIEGIKLPGLNKIVTHLISLDSALFGSPNII